MKKPNKRAQQIKMRKAQKRVVRSKSNRGRSQERLNAKSNSIEKAKKELFQKYLDVMSKQFETGSKESIKGD